MDQRYLFRIRIIDKLARLIISAGGVAIIGSMLLIILFLFKVTLPLFSKPSPSAPQKLNIDLAGHSALASGLGPYLELLFLVNDDSTVNFYQVSTGILLQSIPIPHPDNKIVVLKSVQPLNRHHYSILWADGAAAQVAIHVKPVFDEMGVRSLEPGVIILNSFVPETPLEAPFQAFYRKNHEGLLTYVSRRENQLFLTREKQGQDIMGMDYTQKESIQLDSPLRGLISSWAMDESGTRLFLASDRGELVAWLISDFDEPQRIGPIQISEDAVPVSALGLAFGDVSLLVGQANGNISAWNLKARRGWRKIHDLPGHHSAISQIRPSLRDKSFASIDQEGKLQLAHLTSEQELTQLQLALPIKDASFSERFDGMLLQDKSGEFYFQQLQIPHPEISTGTLWGRVWYENYEKPEFVWQSSSGSNDFEPKLSLVPLLFGSLKGTFYGMLLSLPLAIMAAIYVSHMMQPRFRILIKPIIELMAAVPTVVIGFLAALWLSPILGRNLLGLACCLLSLPIVTALGMFIGLTRPKRPTGYEFIWAVPLLALACWLAFSLGNQLEQSYFGGNLNLWLFKEWGWSIDQRNCVVVSFALGFAVIPIIFTISEDALHNVPKSQTAAATALGSSRWQTIRRVVLPMAGPGIFAAVMIGFGRAVGETMIVLMATGNTPILSPSILNGMRTLAANIAAEIPEAPVGGTLFRVLFLSALLLFALTFLVNTLAELVRARLEQRYRGL